MSLSEKTYRVKSYREDSFITNDGWWINEKDVKEAVKDLKESLRTIVWDIALAEGGSNLHYNDVIDEKINEIFGEDLT